MKLQGKIKTQASLSPTFHVFDFDRFPPSIANLSAALTINGTTVYPSLRYNGKDAEASGWNPWGYGKQLALQTGTAPTYNNGSPLLGSIDDSVLFNGGGKYQYPDNTAFITTGDFCIETLVKMSTESGSDFRTILVQMTDDGNYWGISFFRDSSNNLYWYMDDGTGAAQIALSVTAYLEQWVLIHLFGNRDENTTNGCKLYVNGIDLGTGTNISARQGSLNKTVPLIIGGHVNSLTPARTWNRQIAYISGWTYPSWFAAGATGPSQWAIAAATRFAQLTGTYPNQARGATKLPTFTRATTAYLDKLESNGVRKLYKVGTGWPRTCSRLNTSGGILKGYLSEVVVTNLCASANCRDMDGVGWNQDGLTSDQDVSINAPDGTNAGDNKLTEINLDNGYHGNYSTIVATAQSYVVSAFLKNGTRRYVMLLMNSGDNYAFFDLQNGVVVGVTGVGTTQGIEDWSNGWYLCWGACTWAAGAAKSYGVYLSTNGSTVNYIGDSGKYLYCDFFQVETGVYPSSRVITTAARNADVLTYIMSDGNLVTGKSVLSYNILSPSYTPISDGYAVTLSNAGSATVRISSSFKTTERSNLAIVNSTLQANITGSTNVINGNIHSIKNTWDTNLAKLEVANTQEGTIDTSVSVPTITQLDISDNAGTNQVNGLINNVKIFGNSNIK